MENNINPQCSFVKKSMSLNQLLSKFTSKKLNFNLSIQRKENIWDIKKQSLLVHSILTNYIVPPIVAIKDEKILDVIDGKQRLTSLFSFINNGFSLDANMPPLRDLHLNGLTFGELDETLKKKILNFKFDVYIGENLNEQEIEDLFYRLNNGVPLNSIEITRAVLGRNIIAFLSRITSQPFFEKKINMSASSKKRFTDQELVLQILKLIKYPDSGLSSKDMKGFVQELKDEELKTRLQSSIDNVLYYLNEAFPKKEKFLKKINVPILFLLVLTLIHNNLTSVVTNDKFGKWATEFFENTPAEYKDACTSNSAGKENVQKRINSMFYHFSTSFMNELDNKKLEPIKVNY